MAKNQTQAQAAANTQAAAVAAPVVSTAPAKAVTMRTIHVLALTPIAGGDSVVQKYTRFSRMVKDMRHNLETHNMAVSRMKAPVETVIQGEITGD